MAREYFSEGPPVKYEVYVMSQACLRIFVSEYRVSLYFVVLLKWCQSYPEAAVWNLYWWTWKRQCDQQRLSFSAQISNHNHDRGSYNFHHLLRKYPTVREWYRGPEIENKDYYVTSGIENCVSLMIPNRISEDPFCSFGQFKNFLAASREKRRPFFCALHLFPQIELLNQI